MAIVVWISDTIASAGADAVAAAVAATLVADGRSSAADVAAVGRYTSQTVPCGRLAASARKEPARIRRLTVVADTPRMDAACSTVTAVVAATVGVFWPLVAAGWSLMVGD